MKNIRIILSYEFLSDNLNINPYSILFEKVKREGYNYLNGGLGFFEEIETKNVNYIYYPSKKDILFKQFKRWKPEWMKKKEILFRKF